ncbi:MAG: hypothetical protein Q7V02_01635 [Methylophilus sp.]|nr:hypothetical protein [Methylophilus sp.]
MKPKSLHQIFLWPFVLAMLMLFGLIAALIEDSGLLEQLGVIAMVIPLTVIFYFYKFKKF